MRQDAAVKGVEWIGVGAIIIGLIFIIAGAIVSGIAYTEITPPNYDDNYDRYIGSSVPRLIGPFILCFGGLIVLGSCGIIGYRALNQYEPLPKQQHQYPTPTKQEYHDHDDHEEYTKDYNPKMTP